MLLTPSAGVLYTIGVPPPKIRVESEGFSAD